jgi:hypothetical protein
MGGKHKKRKMEDNYLMNAAANPLNANAIASPAFANAPLPAHATALPLPAHVAFTGVVVAGKMNAIAVIATSAPITRRFVFINLP